MKNKKIFSFLLILPVLFGFSFNLNLNKIQLIKIDYYDDTQNNIELVKDLVLYSSLYIRHKIPEINSDILKGIKVGYFLKGDELEPYFRIIYDMKNDHIRYQVPELEKKLNAYISNLIQDHIGKESVFEKAKSIGYPFVTSLINGDHYYDPLKVHRTLKESDIYDKLRKLFPQLIEKNGGEYDIEYYSSQYYEAFIDDNNSVTISYDIIFKNDKKLLIQLFFLKESDNWLVAGITLRKSLQYVE